MATTSKKNTKRPNRQTLGITYRGVSVSSYKTNSGWGYRLRSRIYKNGTEFYLGSFTEAEDAANAYNKKARSLFTEKRAKAKGMWNDLNA